MSDVASVLTVSPVQVAEWLGMALIAAVGWFARNAFVGLTDEVKAMSSHLASINVTLAEHEGERKLLANQHETLADRVEAIEGRVRDLERSRFKTGEYPRAEDE